MEEADEHIAHARVEVGKNKYEKALEIFLIAFERNPNLRAAHEAEFRSVLMTLNTNLAEYNKINDIFTNFERAFVAFPDNVDLHNDAGKYLYQFEFYPEACLYFEKVLKISPSHVDAEKNFNSLKNLLMERWHFRMLNDNIRNESYRHAIRQTIRTRDEIVFDVGTGTGLLAMYACEGRAQDVIGCDSSELMANLAKEIIQKNKYLDIKIFNKMSEDLNPWDLGGPCTILVTEMFDAGLFGEHVLQMLTHAWSALLSSRATVIPNTAEFFVVGVQCDHLIKNYQLCPNIKTLLNIPSLNVHSFTPDETYDCEDVHLMKDIKYLTEPQSLLKINFNDLKDINDTLKKTEPYEVKLKVKESGQMDLVIGWFNLYLSDIITTTTNPIASDRANAWQQAVFFDDIPKTVKREQTIKMKFLVNGGKLTKLPSSKEPITRVSAQMIRFLNDLKYIEMITASLGMACVHLGQLAEMSELTVVDLCTFPVFGLHMLKRGAKSLLCCATNDNDKEFIVKVFKENQVSMNSVTIIYGADWTSDIFKDDKYHAIFTHMLDSCGDVDVRLKEIAEHLKHSHLIQGGLYMPAQVKLVGQLVRSRWLDINNRVYDDNVSNFKIAEFMNYYSVTQNFDIDFSILKYTPMSEAIVLCNYPDGARREAKTVPIINNGNANAILCWYSIGLMEKIQEIATNRANSFISGMLFLTYSKVEFVAGMSARIIQHKDTDGCFKLAMEPLVT